MDYFSQQDKFVTDMVEAYKTRFKLLAWRSDKIVGDTYAAHPFWGNFEIETLVDDIDD